MKHLLICGLVGRTAVGFLRTDSLSGLHYPI